MTKALLNGFIRLFFYVVSLLGSIIFVPLQTILTTLIPEIEDYFTLVENFFNETLTPFLIWIRVSICNVMCLDDTIWMLYATWLLALILAAPAVRVLKLIYNLYKTIKGTYNK